MNRVTSTLCFITSVAVCFKSSAFALTLSGSVTTIDGEPVAEAVITAEGLLKTKITSAKSPYKMDQKNQEFKSHILALHVGESVLFPNSDNIQHHVYSFSPTNPFEIQLYKGIPASPISFNKAGIVTLGCNIHDWMVGYIYVTDTPFFVQTDEKGHWQIDLPTDEYTLTLWHPQLDLPNNTQTQVINFNAKATPIEYKVHLKSTIRTGKHPADSEMQNPIY